MLQDRTLSICPTRKYSEVCIESDVGSSSVIDGNRQVKLHGRNSVQRDLSSRSEGQKHLLSPEGVSKERSNSRIFYLRPFLYIHISIRADDAAFEGFFGVDRTLPALIGGCCSGLRHMRVSKKRFN